MGLLWKSYGNSYRLLWKLVRDGYRLLWKLVRVKKMVVMEVRKNQSEKEFLYLVFH